VADIFVALEQRDRDQTHARRSYFWTLGGPDYRSQIIMCDGLPQPFHFTGLLTGRFDAREVA
jgi:type VI secretion system protein ImpM